MTKRFFRAAAGVKGAQEDYGDTTYAMLKALAQTACKTPVQGMNNGMPVGTTRLYMDEKRFTFIPSAWPGFPCR